MAEYDSMISKKKKKRKREKNVNTCIDQCKLKDLKFWLLQNAPNSTHLSRIEMPISRSSPKTSSYPYSIISKI